jgi:uncharacterized protein YecT (DUF1311 family)
MAGTVLAAPSIDQQVRDCVVQAGSTAALAACEQQGLKAWRARVEELHQALLTRLPAAQRAPYVAAHEAWEGYRQRETSWIDHSFARRPDGLGEPLAAGAKSELWRRRAEQLSTYLSNLPVAQTD